MAGVNGWTDRSSTSSLAQAVRSSCPMTTGVVFLRDDDLVAGGRGRLTGGLVVVAGLAQAHPGGRGLAGCQADGLGAAGVFTGGRCTDRFLVGVDQGHARVSLDGAGGVGVVEHGDVGEHAARRTLLVLQADGHVVGGAGTVGPVGAGTIAVVACVGAPVGGRRGVGDGPGRSVIGAVVVVGAAADDSSEGEHGGSGDGRAPGE